MSLKPILQIQMKQFKYVYIPKGEQYIKVLYVLHKDAQLTVRNNREYHVQSLAHNIKENIAINN